MSATTTKKRSKKTEADEAQAKGLNAMPEAAAHAREVDAKLGPILQRGRVASVAGGESAAGN